MDLSSPVDQLSVLRSADTFMPNPGGFNNAVFAQAQQFSGSRLLGDNRVVKTTVDTLGNRYTIGTFSGTVDFDASLVGTNIIASEGSGDNLFISKLDSNGNFVWAKSMGGDSYDYVGGIAIDASGNIYTTGTFRGTVDLDPSLTGTTNRVSAGGTDIFISKLDSNGNLVWAKSIGGTGDENSRDLAIDASGNIYTTGSFQGTVDFDRRLTGTTTLTSAGSDDIFINKLDSSGNFVWAKAVGGANSDGAAGLAIDLTGNVYTTGYYNSGYFGSTSVDFDPSLTETANFVSAGNSDIFISKLDSSGNFVWAKSMGGEGYDRATRITIDSSGNVYTCGSFSGVADFDPSLTGTNNLTGNRYSDTFISKLDSSGNFVWAKQMSGGEIKINGALGLAVDSSGNVYTSGYFDGTVDFDPSPTSTNNLVSAGGNDIFISKLNNRGDFVWAKSIGGSLDDYAIDLAIDASGNVYTAGTFQGMADFDPSLTGVANFIGDAGGVFLSKLTTDGNFAQAQQFSGSFLGQVSKTAVDTLGNRYTIGTFWGTVDFDPSLTGKTYLTSEGVFDIFISKLDSSGNFVWAKSLGGQNNENIIELAIDDSSNVYTSGTFQGTVDFDPSLAGTSNLIGSESDELFVSKLDSSGNFVWAKSLGEASYQNNNLTGMAIDGSGNVYTTGAFSGTVDFDPSSAGTANLVGLGNHSIFTRKLDRNGNFIWAKLLGGNDYSYTPSKIAVDRSGNVYTTGAFQGTVDFDPNPTGTANLVSERDVNLFISKLDTNGNFIWAKALDRSDGAVYISNIATDASGNVYTTGSFTGTIDFDPSPTSTNNLGYGIVLERPSNPRDTANLPGADIFVSKLDSSGNFAWAKRIGNRSISSYIRTNNLEIDRSGDVYIAGDFDGTIDFDPSSTGTTTLTSTRTRDVFISKLNNSGNFVWAKQIGGKSYDTVSGLAVDRDGNIYTSGYFYEEIDLDPGVGTTNLKTRSGSIFLSKLSQVTEARQSEIFWRNPNGIEVFWQLDNTKLVGLNLINSPYDTPAWSLKGSADMNDDGVKDQIYQNTITRQLGYLLLSKANGVTTAVKAELSPTFTTFFGAAAGQAATPGAGWELVGIENVAGTDQADLIFYSRSLDRLVYWETNAAGQVVGARMFTSSLNPGGQGTGAANSWNVEAIADFTGDGKADVLWRNTEGVTVLWKVNGSVIDLEASKVLPTMTNNFELRGVGDFNGDGIQDVVWRDKAANITRFWTFNRTGSPAQTTDNNAIVSAGFQIEAIADFDGDRKSDLVWRDTVSDRSVIWNFDLSGALAGPTFQVGSIRPGSNFIRNFLPNAVNNKPFINSDINWNNINSDRNWDIDAATGI
jgi:hypothetical protein